MSTRIKSESWQYLGSDASQSYGSTWEISLSGSESPSICFALKAYSGPFVRHSPDAPKVLHQDPGRGNAEHHEVHQQICIDKSIFVPEIILFCDQALRSSAVNYLAWEHSRELLLIPASCVLQMPEDRGSSHAPSQMRPLHERDHVLEKFLSRSK